MNFQQALANATRERYSCKVAEVLADLDPQDRALAEQALADPSYSHNQISDAFRGIEKYVCSTTVNKHRSGACRCA